MSKSSHANRLPLNRKWLFLIACALLAVALATLYSLSRPQPTIEYLVANRDLPSGTLLEASAFTAMPLALGASGRNYLGHLPAAMALRSPLRAGELLSIDDIGRPSERFSVVLSPSEPLSAKVHVGSQVDVWFVSKAGSLNQSAEPIRVAAALEVLSLHAIDSAISGSLNAGLSVLEVAANEADLPALMLASADGGFISVVSGE